MSPFSRSTETDSPPFRLRELPGGARFALTLLLLVNLGGFVASGLHMVRHHRDRDQQEGFTLVDIQGAYHGVMAESPLLRALESEHPGELDGYVPLPEKTRDSLIGWLRDDRIAVDYDSLDLGDAAPAEVIAANCLVCHSRNAGDGLAVEPMLDYFDDVKSIAFSKDVPATSEDILLASTHTHAIALATTTLLLVVLMLFSSWPAGVRDTLTVLASLGLTVDLASWWLARQHELFVYGIVGGGAVYAAAVGLMSLALLVDLWKPKPAPFYLSH